MPAIREGAIRQVLGQTSLARYPLRCPWRVHLCPQQCGDAPRSGDRQRAARHPIGGFSFLVMTIAFGQLGQLVVFPVVALAWLAGQGVVHFVLGRYCNYKSNQLMGVNLTAPVVQLQVPFAMMLAVVVLHEKFTVLQAIGSALMLGGSFITQANAGKGKRKASALL